MELSPRPFGRADWHAEGQLMTFSLPLVMHFLAGGPFVTALPNTVASLHPARDLLSVLPVGDISASPWPVTIVTLKDRTLSPIVERFKSAPAR